MWKTLSTNENVRTQPSTKLTTTGPKRPIHSGPGSHTEGDTAEETSGDGGPLTADTLRDPLIPHEKGSSSIAPTLITEESPCIYPLQRQDDCRSGTHTAPAVSPIPISQGSTQSTITAGGELLYQLITAPATRSRRVKSAAYCSYKRVQEEKGIG